VPLAESFRAHLAATTAGALIIAPRLAGHSVRVGCAGLAATSHTIRRPGSGRYQIRPPAVTSYCHWSSTWPPNHADPQPAPRHPSGHAAARSTAPQSSHRSETEQGRYDRHRPHAAGPITIGSETSHARPRLARCEASEIRVRNRGGWWEVRVLAAVGVTRARSPHLPVRIADTVCERTWCLLLFRWGAIPLCTRRHLW
jgi:hypothetical protein